MNNQGGDLYYLDYSFASGIEEKKERAAWNQAAEPYYHNQKYKFKNRSFIYTTFISFIP